MKLLNDSKDDVPGDGRAEIASFNYFIEVTASYRSRCQRFGPSKSVFGSNLSTSASNSQKARAP
jgi:hypothetical protein